MPATHASRTPRTVRRWVRAEATDRRSVWRCFPVPTTRLGCTNLGGGGSNSLPASKQRGTAEHLSPRVCVGGVGGEGGGQEGAGRSEECSRRVAKASQSLPSSQPPAGARAARSREVRGPGCKAKPRKRRPLCPRPASAAASCICPFRGACSASRLRVLTLAEPPAGRSRPLEPRVPAAGRRGARWVPGARSQGLPTPSGVSGGRSPKHNPLPHRLHLPSCPERLEATGRQPPPPPPPASASLSPFPRSSLLGNKGAFYKADCWRLRRWG